MSSVTLGRVARGLQHPVPSERLSEGSPPLVASFGDSLTRPCPVPGKAGSYREGIWYVIMTLSSVSAISSQTGSWRTHLMKCLLSSTSAFTFAL